MQSGGQTIAGTEWQDERQVRMQSGKHEVLLISNLPNIAEELEAMSRGTQLQEALENGAREQWQSDSSWTLDVLVFTEPDHPMYWATLRANSLARRRCRKRER